jgi:hypothetical protein
MPVTKQESITNQCYFLNDAGHNKTKKRTHRTKHHSEFKDQPKFTKKKRTSISDPRARKHIQEKKVLSK